jgi:hypothetical protein
MAEILTIFFSPFLVCASVPLVGHAGGKEEKGIRRQEKARGGQSGGSSSSSSRSSR